MFKKEVGYMGNENLCNEYKDREKIADDDDDEDWNENDDEYADGEDLDDDNDGEWDEEDD